MKIKMNTISAGPNPSLNWHEGEEREVCPEEAEHWIKQGVAKSCETAIMQPSEKVVTGPKEKAVVQPTETTVKAPAPSPAKSGNTQTSNSAPTWSTPGVK